MKNAEDEIKKLRNRIAELVYQHQLDMAEITRLRRWIEALEEEDDANT